MDSFLNHQMDVALIEQIVREVKACFGHERVSLFSKDTPSVMLFA